MKKTIILAALALALSSTDAFSWGQKGHDVTCAIAEKHLSCKARKEIDRILDGKSIVYWSKWMDNASHRREYAYTKTWHYRDVDPGENFDTLEPDPSGDVLTALEAQIKALKSGGLNKDAQALSLKMIIHFMGDMHCPMHMGYKSDKGGNLRQVQFFKAGKNLHSVWDTELVESAHRWNYSEWVDQVDRIGRKERKAIVEGSLKDWGRETYGVTRTIYAETPSGKKMSYDEVERWTPVVEQQLLRGGLRLAWVLNDIFK